MNHFSKINRLTLLAVFMSTAFFVHVASAELVREQTEEIVAPETDSCDTMIECAQGFYPKCVNGTMVCEESCDGIMTALGCVRKADAVPVDEEIVSPPPPDIEIPDEKVIPEDLATESTTGDPNSDVQYAMAPEDPFEDIIPPNPFEDFKVERYESESVLVIEKEPQTKDFGDPLSPYETVLPPDAPIYVAPTSTTASVTTDSSFTASLLAAEVEYSNSLKEELAKKDLKIETMALKMNVMEAQHAQELAAATEAATVAAQEEAQMALAPTIPQKVPVEPPEEDGPEQWQVRAREASDYNCDGITEAHEYGLTVSHLLELFRAGLFDAAYDFDGSGVVNFTDIQIVAMAHSADHGSTIRLEYLANAFIAADQGIGNGNLSVSPMEALNLAGIFLVAFQDGVDYPFDLNEDGALNFGDVQITLGLHGPLEAVREAVGDFDRVLDAAKYVIRHADWQIDADAILAAAAHRRGYLNWMDSKKDLRREMTVTTSTVNAESDEILLALDELMAIYDLPEAECSEDEGPAGRSVLEREGLISVF